jgi:hypothetical protein
MKDETFMTQKIQTLLIDDLDDLDGSEAKGTVRFGHVSQAQNRRPIPCTRYRPIPCVRSAIMK